MNTPKSKKPVRWDGGRKDHPVTGPAGAYFGIKNQEIATAYGFLVSYWWHVEEVMTFVFQDLLEGKRNEQFSSSSAARNVFRTIVAQETRIKLMRALLEGAPQNAGMPEIYDQIIDEFAELNRIRNSLVHGSWTTDTATGTVTVRQSSNVPNELQPPKTITAIYLNQIAWRMMELHGKATTRGLRAITSLGTPVQRD